MKLQVRIHRQASNEVGTGTLRAYVSQEGRRGANLLTGHQFSDVTSAQRKAEWLLHQKFGREVEIQFLVDA